MENDRAKKLQDLRSEIQRHCVSFEEIYVQEEDDIPAPIKDEIAETAIDYQRQSILIPTSEISSQEMNKPQDLSARVPISIKVEKECEDAIDNEGEVSNLIFCIC